jgi:hypothetical protein
MIDVTGIVVTIYDWQQIHKRYNDIAKVCIYFGFHGPLGIAIVET